MALQGTLDTFALPDVLRLLASTGKTGCLRVQGARGEGNVWLDGGAVVAADASGVPAGVEPIEVIVELLRYLDGSFVFEAGSTMAYDGDAAEIEPMLVEAEQLLGEWVEITAVVPSLDSWVSLVEELPAEEVAVDARAWRAITAIGGGSAVRDVGTWLGLGEVGVSRVVKEIVERGLAEVSEAPQVVESDPGGLSLSGGASGFPDQVLPPLALPVEGDASWSPQPAAEWTPRQWTPPEDDWETLPVEGGVPWATDDDPRPSDGAEVGEPDVDEAEDTAPTAIETDDQQDPQDENNEQGPQEPPESQDVPVAEEEPIDRSRLLKFLGSVRS